MAVAVCGGCRSRSGSLVRTRNHSHRRGGGVGVGHVGQDDGIVDVGAYALKQGEVTVGAGGGGYGICRLMENSISHDFIAVFYDSHFSVDVPLFRIRIRGLGRSRNPMPTLARNPDGILRIHGDP